MITSLEQQVSRYRKQKRKFFLAEKRGIPVYESYFFSGWEKLFYIACSAGITGILAFFFYRSCWTVPLLAPAGVAVYISFQSEKGEKRRQKLEAEFKDCILSVSANLRAGYSVENAFLECGRDMISLYGEKGLIIRELCRVKKGLSNNVPLEQLLKEFGERSCCANIREFGEVFSIAGKSGGNLPEIIKSTADLIGEEISVKQEIRTSVSGKLFEQKIMTVIPFIMMAYVEAGNPGFFNVLYHNPAGWAIMTVCLMLYLAAYKLAKKICAITV